MSWDFLLVYLNINDILVSPYLKTRSTIKVNKVPIVTEACEISCNYSNTHNLSSNFTRCIKGSTDTDPAIWQQMA